MIAAGVKFRKSPTHTCDLATPKIVKFPKVDPNELFDVLIQKGGIIDTGKAYRLRCRAQIIEGIKIPNGHEFWTPTCVITKQFAANPVAHIKGHIINDMLRFLVMEGLRRG